MPDSADEALELLERRRLLEEMQSRGWDLLDPSEECLAAIACPSMPEYLSMWDVLGIHRELAWLRAFSSFLAERSWTGKAREQTVARGKALLCAVHCLVVQTHTRGPLTRTIALGTIEDLNAWTRYALRPSMERLQALQREPDDPRAFQPAYTLAGLKLSSGLVDVDFDRRELASALAVFGADARALEGGDPLGAELRRVASDAEPISVDELAATFEFLVSGGEVVTQFDRSGKLRLRWIEALNALERRSGRVPSTGPQGTQADAESLNLTLASRRAEDADSAERLERDELNERFADVVARLLAEERSPTHRKMLENAARLATDEVSATELARELGLSPRTARAAWAAVRARLGSALRAFEAA